MPYNLRLLKLQQTAVQGIIRTRKEETDAYREEKEEKEEEGGGRKREVVAEK